MPAPRKYPDELKNRAIRLTLDALADPDRSRGCFRRVGDELGVNPETLRGWVRQTRIDAGDRPGTTTEEARRIKELEKEVREPGAGEAGGEVDGGGGQEGRGPEAGGAIGRSASACPWRRNERPFR